MIRPQNSYNTSKSTSTQQQLTNTARTMATCSLRVQRNAAQTLLHSSDTWMSYGAGAKGRGWDELCRAFAPPWLGAVTPKHPREGRGAGTRPQNHRGIFSAPTVPYFGRPEPTCSCTVPNIIDTVNTEQWTHFGFSASAGKLSLCWGTTYS